MFSIVMFYFIFYFFLDKRCACTMQTRYKRLERYESSWILTRETEYNLFSNYYTIGPQPAVPLHLRNAPTKLMRQLNYGKGYNMQDKEVSGLEYMPEGMEDHDYFS